MACAGPKPGGLWKVPSGWTPAGVSVLIDIKPYLARVVVKHIFLLKSPSEVQKDTSFTALLPDLGVLTQFGLSFGDVRSSTSISKHGSDSDPLWDEMFDLEDPSMHDMLLVEVRHCTGKQPLGLKFELICPLQLRGEAWTVILPAKLLHQTPMADSSSSNSRTKSRFLRVNVKADDWWTVFQACFPSHNKLFQPIEDVVPCSEWQMDTVQDEAPRDLVVLLHCKGPRLPRCVIQSLPNSTESAMLSVITPYLPRRCKLPPGELLFLVDCTASMGGKDKLPLARSAALLFLQHLSRASVSAPFNVLAYLGEHRCTCLFDHCLPSTPEALVEAAAYVNSLRPSLTKMAPTNPLDLVVWTPIRGLRQVILLTGGTDSSGLNQSLHFLSLKQHGSHNLRLFPLGIGHGCCGTLLHRLAEVGGGVAASITVNGELVQAVQQQFERLSHPVLKETWLEWDSPSPRKICYSRSLFSGDPIFVPEFVPQDQVPCGPRKVRVWGFGTGGRCECVVEVPAPEFLSFKTSLNQLLAHMLLERCDTSVHREDLSFSHCIVTPFCQLCGGVEKESIRAKLWGRSVSCKKEELIRSGTPPVQSHFLSEHERRILNPAELLKYKKECRDIPAGLPILSHIIGAKDASSPRRQRTDTVLQDSSQCTGRWTRPVARLGTSQEALQTTLNRLNGLLNKLTVERFELLFQEILVLDISTLSRLSGAVNLLYLKAVQEPTFSGMYSNLAMRLSHSLPSFQENGHRQSFARLLLNRCFLEFYNRPKDACLDSLSIPSQLDESVVQELPLRMRLRMNGLVRFIGELYIAGMIPCRLIFECASDLLSSQPPRQFDLELISRLLTTVGLKLERQSHACSLKRIFVRLQQHVHNTSLSPRIRFMLQDLVDLSNNGWIPRIKTSAPQKLATLKVELEHENGARFTRSHTRWESWGGEERKKERSPSPKLPKHFDHRRTVSALELPVVSPQPPVSPAVPAEEKPTDFEEIDSLRETFEVILEEHLLSLDLDNTVSCLEEESKPDEHYHFVQWGVCMVVERNITQRNRMIELFVDLFKREMITQDHLEKGLLNVIGELDELDIDVPHASKYVADMLGNILAQDCLPFSYLCDVCLRIPSNPAHFLGEACLAISRLEKLDELLEKCSSEALSNLKKVLLDNTLPVSEMKELRSNKNWSRLLS